MHGVSIFQHLRNYASAGVLSALVGVVSFPILTRNLSVEQYGILGLITASLTFFIAVGKLGVQHAVIRYWSEVRSGRSTWRPAQLDSTVTLLFLLLACATTLVWLAIGMGLLPRWVRYPEIDRLFAVAGAVVFVRLLGSGIMNFLRAEQHSGIVSVALVLSRGVNLLLIVALLLFSELGPASVLLCLLLGELVAVAYAAWCRRDRFVFAWRELSTPLARALLTYGMPLMILESLGLVLRLSDRYLIEVMLGVEALGQYSASYNLVVYLDIIVLASLVQAVKPMYMHLWEHEGPEATRQFLSHGFHVFLVVGIPFVALFSLTSPHLLSFLAGGKYSPGTIIIPFVTLSVLFDGCMHFLAAGLYIGKETRAMMRWGGIATIVNLGLNILFIPAFGILGAAMVTAASFALFMLGVTRRAFRHVAFFIDLRVPAIMTLGSLCVYALLSQLAFHSDLLNLLVKGSLGTVLLLAMLLLVDPSIRSRLTLLRPQPGLSR